MSAQPLSAPRRPTAPGRAERPRVPLVAVPLPAARAPRAPFVALVIGLLGGGLIALLLLNTALAQGAFALRDLQRRSVALTEEQQELATRLADEQQPGALARRARALGMVPGGVPAFLRLPDGTVVGTPHAASRPAPAVPTPAAAALAKPATSAPAAKATKTTKTTKATKATKAAPRASKPTTKPAGKPTRRTKP
ncbi:MAG: hypothetical protein ACJ74O_07175 [Frankiaceae bacterium]